MFGEAVAGPDRRIAVGGADVDMQAEGQLAAERLALDERQATEKKRMQDRRAALKEAVAAAQKAYRLQG